MDFKRNIFYIDSYQEKFSQIIIKLYTQKYFIIFLVRPNPGLRYHQIHAHFNHMRAVLRI